MHLVAANDSGFEGALVAQRDLDAAVGARDDVEVGEDMAGLVEDESRTLALLRHRSIEDVEAHCSRGNIHNRRQHVPVDRNVVLFLGIKSRSRLRLGQFEGRVRTATTDECRRMQTGREMRGDEPESTYQQKHKKKLAQLHTLLDLDDLSMPVTRQLRSEFPTKKQRSRDRLVSSPILMTRRSSLSCSRPSAGATGARPALEVLQYRRYFPVRSLRAELSRCRESGA